MGTPEHEFDQIAALFRAATRERLLREALAFYADPANYTTTSTGFAAQYDPEPAPVLADKGARARSAIEAAIVRGCLRSDGS